MYILSDSPWLMNTCHRRPYRNIWKLRVFWFTYSTTRMSCVARKRSRSRTFGTKATGGPSSSRSFSAPVAWRASTTTGHRSASAASGRYHCRIWYMFTAPSAKYTATWKCSAGYGT